MRTFELNFFFDLRIKTEGSFGSVSFFLTFLSFQVLGTFSSLGCVFFFFNFLGPHLQLIKIPRLGVELERQLPVYTTATATQDPSHVCNLHQSSRQRWILNPRSEAGDGTRNLMVHGRIRFCRATTGTPVVLISNFIVIRESRLYWFYLVNV